MLLILAVAIGILPWQGPAPAAASSLRATFTFEDGVTDYDAGYVVEGIRLAQDFFERTLEVEMDRTVSVFVTMDDTRSDTVVASAIADTITVFAGSRAWNQKSPGERYAVIVHEYTHIYQYLMLEEDIFPTPAWFDEGLADYMSMLAVSELGLLSRQDLEDYWGILLWLAPPDEPLSAYESWPVYQSSEQSIYQLSYFSIALLLEDRDIRDVHRFYQLMAVAPDYETAFQQAFGLTLAQHYANVDAWWQTFVPATRLPSDVAVYKPVERSTTVRQAIGPRIVAPDEQILVQAQTLPASVCVLDLTLPETTIAPIARATFADGTGDVYWLVTVPADAPPGSVRFRLDCGADAVVLSAIVH